MGVACTKCGAGNDDDAAFCVDCGTRLAQTATTCASCGATDRRGRFCSACGAVLSALPAEVGVRVPVQAAPGSHAPVAERRLTSVLFADLVGFTTIAESRDAEDVRELLSRYFTAARTVVHRYGGTVEKFIGDAVMAVWGVPTAHEDDAERAVRAALELVDRVNGLAEETGVSELALRVGVVTGEVAVTLGATGEGMVAGDAVNTASRVQSIAAAGQVWVDDPTRTMTAAAVAYADAGEHLLKGKSVPVRLHQARAVVAAIGGAQRVDGLEAPFVGRDRELRLVKELFEATVEDRRSRLVVVSGVAGMGKSRLGWEFEKYIHGLTDVIRWHRGRSLSYGDGVAFWALAEIVRGRLGLTETATDEELTTALTAGLEQWVPDEQDRRWLRPRLGALLGVESNGFPRDDVFSAWTVFLERVAAGSQALVLLVEDLQYADDGLLDFLDHALDTARFPLFVLGLARPELVDRRPDFVTGRRKTTVHLEPLSETAMGVLVDGLVDGIPAATRSALVERAEGIPLYAVETVRALIDRDAVVPRDGRYVLSDDAAANLDVVTLGAPASLHALVSSRLDALGERERSLVQDAAVLGMSFTRQSLAALRDGDLGDLEPLLATLVRKEIFELQKDPQSPERGQYRFVQAVVRQVAYETLGRRDRKARHLAVARYLSDEPDQGGDLSAVLAQHYLDAVAASGTADEDVTVLVTEAQSLLERAAQRAMGLGSPAEALRHYVAALGLPVTDDVQARLDEGAATAAMSLADTATTSKHATRAIGVHEAAGQPVEAARCAAVLARTLMQHQDLTGAIELLKPHYDALCDRDDADDVLLDMTETLGQSHLYIGESAIGRAYVERMLLIAEARADVARIAVAMTHWSSLWIIDGMPTAARAVLNRAVELARELHQPTALIRPLINTAAFNSANDLDLALAAAREATSIAQQSGNRSMESLGEANLICELWHSGRWGELATLLDEPPPDATDWAMLAGRNMMAQTLAVNTAGEVLQLPEEIVALAASEDLQGRAWAMSAQAAGLVAAEDQPQRAALAAEAVRVCVSWSGTDDDFVSHWAPAVEAAVAAGDVHLTNELLDIVQTRPPGLVSRYAHAELLRLRASAALAASDADPDRIEADLRSAIDELGAFGAPFPRAQAQLLLATQLERRGRSDEAQSHLAAAAATFEALGAAPWLLRVQEALAGHEPAPAVR